MNQANNAAVRSGGQLYRLPAVSAKTGLSKSEIYRRIKVGTFPAPVELGLRARAWRDEDLQTWFQSLAKRGQQ
jgi:prophage regulatory protein